MPSAAQRERAECRRMYLSGETRRVKDAAGKEWGGKKHGEDALLKAQPQYLHNEFESPRPTIALEDLRTMIDIRQTLPYHSYAARDLSDAEVAYLTEYYKKAEAVQNEQLGEKLSAATNMLASQASANHQEARVQLAIVEEGLHARLARLETARLEGMSARQLQQEAKARKQEEAAARARDRLDALLRSVGRAPAEEPLQSLAVYQERLREPALLEAVAKKRELQQEITVRKQEVSAVRARNRLNTLLRSVGRAPAEEQLQSLAVYQERLREPALLEAVAKKREQEKSLNELKKKRPAELHALCDELGVERGTKKQMAQRIVEKRAAAPPATADMICSAGCATEQNKIGPQTFFHQCGAAFWISGFQPLNLEEALAERNILSVSAGTLVRAWPLEQFLEDKDIKRLGCADKELSNQIKAYRLQLEEGKHFKQDAYPPNDEKARMVDRPRKRKLCATD